MSRRQLFRRVKGRWRAERLHQDAKGELGLDHYEGRRYRGWNHHVSVVLVCFAFIVAERVRSLGTFDDLFEGLREEILEFQ